MTEIIIRLPWAQVLGWEQGNMLDVRAAAEHGDDDNLRHAVQTAIIALSWNPYRTAFGSLPYHPDSIYAARIRAAEEVVKRELPQEMQGFFWRFVDLEVSNECVMFNDIMRKQSKTPSQLDRPVYVKKDNTGIYRRCECVVH